MINQPEGCNEVHEERTVEVFAQLVENKPGMILVVWEMSELTPSPVSQLAVGDEVLDHLAPLGPLEVAVHPHVDQLVANAGKPGHRLKCDILLSSLEKVYIFFGLISLSVNVSMCQSVNV